MRDLGGERQTRFLVFAASRGHRWLPVSATRPVVISAHSQTIADQGEKRTGTARFIRPGGRLPRLYRRSPIEDSLRALATLGVRVPRRSIYESGCAREDNDDRRRAR